MATEVIIDAMPFDAQEIIDPQTQEVAYDRVSVAADFARWMKTYFSNGILVDSSSALGNQFSIAASGLALTVQPGSAVINGRTGWMTNSATLTVASGGSSDRYDRVVLELNIPDDRQMSVKVVTGTTSLPPLVRTDDVYQLCLATIKVAAGSATVIVTDTRADESLCGISKIKYVSNTASNIGISETTREAYGLSAANANTDKALQKAIDGSLIVKSFNGEKGDIDFLGERIKSMVEVSENAIYGDASQAGFAGLSATINITLGDTTARRVRLYVAPYSDSGWGFFPTGIVVNNLLSDSIFKGTLIDLYKYENGDVDAEVVAPFYDSNFDTSHMPLLWRRFIRKVYNATDPDASEKYLCNASSTGMDFGCLAFTDAAQDLRQRHASPSNGTLTLYFMDWDSSGNIQLKLTAYSPSVSFGFWTAYRIRACVLGD